MNKPQIDMFEIKPQKSDKARVLIDLDGVIRDFVGSLIRVYRQTFPDHVIRKVNSRKLEDFFPIGEKIYNFMKDGNLYDILVNADPYPGAIESLKKWQNVFEIIIVTAQPEITRAMTFMWLGKNDIPSNEVHISFYKTEIEGFALLDDFEENLYEFKDSGRLAVCLDQAWNQSWNGPRVKTVEEFFNFVQQYFNENFE